MRGLREFWNALVAAALSVVLIFGALSISLVEFIPEAAPTAALQSFPTPVPVTATASLFPTFTSEPGADTPIPAFTNTVLPPSSCQPPPGWVPIFVQPGDTLSGLSSRYRTSVAVLRAGNCLLSDSLPSGTLFFVPPAPTSTVAACIPGASGWVRSYVVKPGDTLYSIAVNHYTTLALLKAVNCRAGDAIYPGDVLWVPNVPTRTPPPSPLPGVTVTPYPTDPLTETALPFTATPQPSATPNIGTPTPIPSPTPVPTSTASPTAFPTNAP